MLLDKLITNLPYNPSLIKKAGSLYVHLKKENSQRRVGLLFILLAFGVQLFILLNPPIATVVSSGNDLVRGGIGERNPKQQLEQYLNTRTELQNIYAHYGIGIAEVSQASVQDVDFSASDHALIGKQAQARFNENCFDQNGATWCENYFEAGSKSPNRAEKALVGTTDSGEWFSVLLDSANILVKNNNTSLAEQNEHRLIGFSEIAEDCSTINGWVIDSLQLDTQKYVSLFINDQFIAEAPSLSEIDSPVGQNGYSLEVPSIYRDGKSHEVLIVASGSFAASELITPEPIELLCNPVDDSAQQNITATSGSYESILETIAETLQLEPSSISDNTEVSTPQEPCDYNVQIEASDPDCRECPLQNGLWINNENCRVVYCDSFSATPLPGSNSFEVNRNFEFNSITPEQISYIVRDEQGSIIQTIESESLLASESETISITPIGSYTIQPKITFNSKQKVLDCARVIFNTLSNECNLIGASTINSSEEDCKSGDYFSNTMYSHPDNQDPLIKSLSAYNNSQLVNAQLSSVKAGETIEYTLRSINRSNQELSTKSEIDVADLLEYSEVSTKSDGGELLGTVLDWGLQSVDQQAIVSNDFRIQILPDIPTTARGSTLSSSGSYDLTLAARYGSSSQLEIQPPSAGKFLEGIVGTFPNVSEATPILISLSVTALTLFYYYRSKIIRYELKYITKGLS